MTPIARPHWFIDFYKVGHVSQYHKAVRQIIANLTPRSSRIPTINEIDVFGLSAVIQEYLIDEFNHNFFAVPLNELRDEYNEVIGKTLGVKNPKFDHIEGLHRHGRVPLTFYALPEGTRTPLNVPHFVVKNTEPGEFFWVPNFFETLLSNGMWMASTSATTARQYRKVLMKHARAFGETDFGFIDWQGHDFSMRGMPGIEAACMSGMGHNIYFSGTDSIPAIFAAKKYYGADYTVGGSVPATEHSVMCAGGQDGEFETFKRLITETYPTGIISIVSDTWDLWRVLTDYIPRLKDVILARDGKIVIRPDSGDPVKIMCGDPVEDHLSPQYFGAVKLLADALGTDGAGHIIKGGVIYGDSITVDRADQILTQVREKWGLSPYNCVFGVGSYTYQYVTRDTFGFAMKATAYKDPAGNIVPIFKKPVTDNGGKFSHFGIPAVYNGPDGYVVQQNANEAELDNCAFQKVFEDGVLLVKPTFDEIRRRARVGL